MSDFATFIDRETPRFREELLNFLRIPSVSADSRHDGDTRGAAEWLRDRMSEIGLVTEVFETPGHPVVLGEWKNAGPSAPTILIYGHYDVQPPDPLDEWTSPPFEPEVREGRIFARGAADDKGQLYMHVKALEACLSATGTLPVNVVLLAEGEEEIGSPNLVPFVTAHRERLACDVALISDSAMFDQDIPSILFALRGLAYLELHIRTADGDLHSGAYGGAVPNPALVMARILASLHDDDGRIAIEGFYDEVLEWDEPTRQAIRGLPFADSSFLDAAGARSVTGEAGFSTLERLWARPSCDANGMLSGYTGEGAKTVLPAKSMAKVSFRLVPKQDPKRVAELFRRHVEAIMPDGVEYSVKELHGGDPWRASPEGWAFEAASAALETAFGRKPVLVGEGGSIPIVSDFERELKSPVLLVGFALPGCNMHAPNEWFTLDNYERGIHALAHMYGEFADRFGEES